MPFAHVIVPPGLPVETKKNMVEKVTDALIEAEGAPPSIRPYVTVLVSETGEGGWGIAGRGHTSEELRSLARDLAKSGG